MNIFLNTFGFLLFIVTVLLLLVFIFKLIIFFLKKKDFPKKLLSIIFICICGFIGIFMYIQYFFTFDTINKQHTQNGPGPIFSPTEEYSANAYYEPYGGAGPSGDVNVWIEITHTKDNIRKIVYYADAKSHFSMKWIDENTLSIVNEELLTPTSNRSIELNIDEEIYHENGLACQSLLMKNSYEKCYQHER